ncbi:MAG: hypothetical protein AUK30_05795 [Nitrospirae bacterium CG2_30_70_394]|nr:MAG: hypothetical protein AUK30_05795 [Nitrospirae bacterium CG2_30_70_394]PIU79209.1 MAG: hypothetical protein COS73_04745 [Nitrospirae bacterium CG06_land_8_20_14_3_00_70_43]PIW83550.1 MAG: hypothetical protein COZ96_02895 [Nitrospirae bacterium CG_4_8_14_3_um_filter_70_85]PIX84085.1 MAG: hypothetical protein COZ33_02040 [Nitrospirae bacterium CG_4_10_14_3_um_filter_70_108]PJB96729.1 MAG: hypothetical protein CO080_02330 [Nitrospirae bacterium CG_4_9_14_0_8_um_filter_70_14]
MVASHSTPHADPVPPLAWRSWCAHQPIPADEARYLLLELLRLFPAALATPLYLSGHQQRRLASWVARRRRGEPLQYITGRAHFFGEVIRVGPGCLVPRPETELVVEHALATLRSPADCAGGDAAKRPNVPLASRSRRGVGRESVGLWRSVREEPNASPDRPLRRATGDDATKNVARLLAHDSVHGSARLSRSGQGPTGSQGDEAGRPAPVDLRRRATERDPAGGGALRLLDLATGSGCIALAIARQRPDVRIVAVDQSAAALAWARLNLHATAVEIRRGDLFAPVAGERFDCICCNPPYVEEGAILPSDVRGYEPAAALFAGADGLAALRRVVAEAPAHLLPGGWLVMEIGAGQGRAVTRLARPLFATVAIHRDYSGHERIFVGRQPP